MAKHIIKHDRDATLNIKGNNQYWELGKKAEITVLPLDSSIFAGIYEAEPSKNNVIKVNGDITMLNGNYGTYGIFSNGMNTTVKVGASSEITATVGIGMEGNSGKAFVNNAGWINAAEWGIELDQQGGKIVNSGTVFSHGIGLFGNSSANVDIINRHHVIADTGIEIRGAGTTFTNAKHGLVSAGIAIEVDTVSTGGIATINNAGTLQGSDFSLQTAAQSIAHVKNTGTMIGDVVLGDGDDIFNTGGGTVKGVIYAYGGNDTITLDKAETQYVEYANGGNDTVRIAGSYTLGDNIENLVLLGKGKLVGNGNALDNVLTGNKAANALYGQDGADILNGKAGNDLLSGGLGSDFFIFAKGGDRDLITDFTQGDDTISIQGFSGIGSFDDFKIEVAANGLDAVIDFGGGDVLTIKDGAMLTFTAADFPMLT